MKVCIVSKLSQVVCADTKPLCFCLGKLQHRGKQSFETALPERAAVVLVVAILTL